jgi:phenylacetate-CoA ligase
MLATAPGIGHTAGREQDLERLVERARRDIPFYRDRFSGISGSRLTDLPASTKADLRPYGAFPLTAGSPAQAHRIAATSGTTGPRLFIAYSSNDWHRIGEQLAERAKAIEFGAGDLLLNTHGYGLWIGGPTLDVLAAVSGAGLLPAGPTSTSQVMEWLGSLPISAISATPSYMRYLIETAQKQGVDPSAWKLNVGFIGGEGASLSLRRQVCAALGTGFRWQELYGSTETGGPVLGYARPDSPLSGQLLLDTREFIIEILKPDADEPVEPGELGEITVTTPYRESSPLIRYRTRDLATEVVDAPPDASGFPRVTQIAGRLDDALKIRGALVYPSAIEEVVAGYCRPGAEWRISVTREPGGLDVLRVQAELDPSESPDDLARLLFDRIAVRPVIDRVPLGSLGRFQGKASRVSDNRAKED